MNKWFLILLISTNVFSNQQIPDKIIYNGRKYYLRGFALNEYLKSKPLSYKRSTNLSCVRGYVATWKIKNNVLYLKKVKKCKGSEEYVVFEQSVKENTEASWFSGKLKILNYKTIKGKDIVDNKRTKILEITSGVIKKEYYLCLEMNNNLYHTGKYYYEKSNYLYSAATFYKLLTFYPDFFKNDWVYFYYLNSLRWLGITDESEKLLNEYKVQFPKSPVMNDFMNTILSIIEIKNDNIQDTKAYLIKIKDKNYINLVKNLMQDKEHITFLQKKENEFYTKHFLPWIYSVKEDKELSNCFLDQITNNALYTNPCKDSNCTSGKIEFEKSELNSVFAKYLTKVSNHFEPFDKPNK